MSHQVQIDYEGIAIQCQSICEVAEAHLKELDEMLAKLERTSVRIMNHQAYELACEINKERNELNRQMEEVAEQAKNNARTRSGGNCLGRALELQRAINKMASQRLIEFQSLLTALLGESISDSYNKMLERGRGVVSVDVSTQQLLDSIADATLKQFTYLAYLQDNTLSGDRLLSAGRALMDKMLNATYESRYAEETAKIRAELEAAKVDGVKVEKVMSEAGGTAREKLIAVREAATQEIVGEKVRQKSLRIIMKAIQERGFIVDRKNIKIKRDTNEVVLVALKASGERAEFRVFLDGKFIYDFHGYEGQACQKDIEPFMHDLEEVYGIHVTKQTEIWSNPDKISTMKYQAMNTNKNKR